MSKALGLFGIGVVGIGVYVVMGAMSETKIHARPVNATFAELTTLPAVPRGVSNLVGVLQSKVSAYTDSVPNQSVTWHFTLKGHEFGHYTASLSPEEADKTRVEFRFENVDPLAGEHIFKLVNIKRGEPSAELFKVPAGFRIESSNPRIEPKNDEK